MCAHSLSLGQRYKSVEALIYKISSLKTIRISVDVLHLFIFNCYYVGIEIYGKPIETINQCHLAEWNVIQSYRSFLPVDLSDKI